MRLSNLSPILLACFAVTAQSPYAKWKNGPSTDPGYFPIGVWLQSPSNAKKYEAIGINVYVGLWKGPTDSQLKALRSAGMSVFGAQTSAALASAHNPILEAWTQQDEPDNAQPKTGGGYGPPVTPATIIQRYDAIRKADPTRPVFLNFGQGVSNENWIGRGTRRGQLQDYPEYIKGADIISFDIYPVVHKDPAVQGKLEFVARGVERLVGWAKGRKIVWNFIETTHIKRSVMPTPHDVKAEVWMSLVHGSMGIVYFAHEWYPKFVEAGLLKYPKMASAVAAINAEIKSLAPVLNSPTAANGAAVVSSNADVPIRHMVKRRGGATWLFAVGMREVSTKGSFTITGLPARAVATVLGEDREIPIVKGKFQDDFAPYGVHLYRIMPKTLDGSPRKIPVTTGGKQKLTLSAGPARANHHYFILGSLSGTLPGIDVGTVNLPLNYDVLTEHMLALPNVLITNSLAQLNAQGGAAAELRVPPLGAAWIGAKLHFAYVTSSGTTAQTASNPVELALIR